MSGRNDPRYNASGYRDDTAYQAIRNVMRESYSREKKRRLKSDNTDDLTRRPDPAADGDKNSKNERTKTK